MGSRHIGGNLRTSRALLLRLYWRLLRACGFKRLSWDKQFEAGRWCRSPRNPDTLDLVSRLCGGGLLMEFGCGEGTLPAALPIGTFSRYVGYDISGVAVTTARERLRTAGLDTVCEFQRCDMASWQGSSGASLIVAEECLYYLSPTQAEAFLRRACASLAAGGNVLVIIHSVQKHATTADVCRRTCRVERELMMGERAYFILQEKRL